MGGIKNYFLPVFASVVSGFFLFLAFPPVSESQAAWVGIAPLLSVAWNRNARVSFYCGILSGLIFWLLSVSWLLKLRETGTTTPLAVLAWLSLSIYASFFLGCFMAVVSRIMSPARRAGSLSMTSWMSVVSKLCLIFLVPVVWVGFEYLRCMLFGGFPWNPLGVSQFRNLSVIQIAQWGGVYSVSAVILVMNTALMFTGLRLVDIYRRKKPERGPRLELMVGLTVCALCWMYGTRICLKRDVVIENTEIRIALVQPNTPQLKKWDDEFEYSIYERLQEQTEMAGIYRPAMIVWPETAVMRPLNECPVTLRFAERLAEDIPILVGSLEIIGDKTGCPGSELCYNSSFLVTAEGIQETYRKQHLVPFGEYVPLEDKIDAIARFVPLGFSCSPGKNSTLFSVVPGGNSTLETVLFSVLICFEDTIPGLARKAVLAGARFIVNQTNDAWFDGSSASVQHMSHCVFRCVENRVPAVRSSNTGVTCFIDRFGAVSTLTGSAGDYGLNMEGIKVSSIVVPSNDVARSIYTRFGDWLFAIPCAIITACFVFFMLGEHFKNRLNKEA